MIITSQGDWVQSFEWGWNQPNQPHTKAKLKSNNTDQLNQISN